MQCQIKTDSKYIYNFAKLRDSSTTFIEDFYANHRINHGVWIDIFPIDGMSYEVKESKKLAYKIRHVWFNIYLAYLPALRRTVRKETWFKDICLNIVAGLFYVFDIAHYRNKYIDRYVRKIDYDKAKMVGNYFGFNMKKEAMPKEWFDEYIEVDFEDIKVINAYTEATCCGCKANLTQEDIGKLIAMNFGYDHDWCGVYKVDEYLNSIKNQYERYEKRMEGNEND